MADIDLNALSLAELKQLEKNVAKAIASFEDRRKAEAPAAAEAVAKEHGFSLSDLARYRLVALGSHRLAGPGKLAGQVGRRGQPVLRGRIRQLSDRGGIPTAQRNAA
ncbi:MULTISPECIES: hypothetical protein [Paracoccus]|uniref:hypothetical protein n=1 Tax=Paracoccus TaxID=265 RepID=UPI001FB7B839|nr:MULTISPECIES: hypothetical protein [Paracoccus]MCJ1900192.1 hypothetical protein [Paracoccus versutus]MDF3906909.1 hypothetical protein [Paracoccus sp. AS002]